MGKLPIAMLFALPAAFSRFVSLYTTYKQGGVSATLILIDDWFDEKLSFFADYMEKFLGWVLGILQLDLPLVGPWVDIVTFLLIYISIQSADALRGSDLVLPPFRWKQKSGKDAGTGALAIRIIAGIVAIALAAVVPAIVQFLFPLALTYTSISMIGSALVGLTVYRFGFAIQFAIDKKREGEKFSEHFTEKFLNIILLYKLQIPLLMFNALINVIDAQLAANFGFWIIVVSILLISLFHYLLSRENLDGDLINWKFWRVSQKRKNRSGHLINAKRLSLSTLGLVAATVGIDFALP